MAETGKFLFVHISFPREGSLLRYAEMANGRSASLWEVQNIPSFLGGRHLTAASADFVPLYYVLLQEQTFNEQQQQQHPSVRDAVYFGNDAEALKVLIAYPWVYEFRDDLEDVCSDYDQKIKEILLSRVEIEIEERILCSNFLTLFNTLLFFLSTQRNNAYRRYKKACKLLETSYEEWLNEDY